MQKTSKRVLAVVLALIMALSVFSISASAYNANYQSETHTVFKHTEQTLAPGVEYYNNYAYSNDGKQMVYYVATADINRDDVLVQGSYLNASIDTMGMSKLTEQVAAANAKFSDPTNPEFISENYTVVAGTNGDFYNMQTGQPSGAFAINGQVMNASNNRPWFAVFEDGTATCGAGTADYDAAVAEHGAVQNAVGGSQLLVKDGADVTANASGSYNTDRHSRTMIGVTADNKVVCAVLDGRQEPFSCGGSMHELAQIMLEAGCEIAINLDGGGSTTFGARPEGEDDFKVLNRPSDGSERSISSGVVIASLAAPSNVFDRVSMSVADEYVTPGTSTDVTVAGVSTSGASADIPAEVTYEVTGGTFADGIFTAGNAAGDAVITAKYNGNTVGSATVHVVVPDSIEFAQESYTIPYSKSSDIKVIAKYGLNEVAVKASDFTLTLADPAAGMLDGFVFTAAGESEIASTTLSAALNGTELTASTTLLFGKGSDVIFDFEDGTTQGFNLNYSNYNYYLPKSKVFVANKENGQVHSGDYALGLNIDYSNSQESGYQMIALYQGKVSGNVDYYEGAIDMGAWLYIPDEYVGLWVRWTISPITAVNVDAETGETSYTLGSITSNLMDRGAGGTGVVYSFDEPGWHYLHTDLSQYKGLAWRDYYYNMQFYISDRDGASYGYYAKDNHNINGDFTVYLDDVTVDYSSVVEDRDAPVFESILLGDRGPHSNDALVLTNGYDSDGYNQLSFSAKVADYSATNATGINGSACKAYVDGNDVGCTYQNGMITAGEEVTLNEGKHSVKFVAYDNQGNRSSITRTFTVSNVSRKELIKVVPHDATLDRVLHGSLYWVDVVTTEAENTSKVITTLNLDSMSKWEIEHMTVADGFKASYKVVDAADKVIELTIEAEGDVAQTGELALVSIPIRTWEMDNMTKRNALNASKKWNYAEFLASNEFWPVAVEVRVQQGLAYYKGSHRYFTGDDVFCWTESWANNANMVATQEGKDYKAAWNGGHDHRPEYADYYADGTTNYVEPRVSKEAKAPTCTEDGWTAELYCDECYSIVQWSEPIPATGHTFEIDETDGLMKCKDCGELCNEAVGGKLYQEGALYTGFYESKYYIDGVEQEYTGVVLIGDKYYEFDENHINKGVYTGVFQKDGKYYYSQLGELTSGWKMIDDEWYYFDATTMNPVATLNNGYVTFEFEENGKLVEGKWYITSAGRRYFYGPAYYRHGWETIDGSDYYFGDANKDPGYCYTGKRYVINSNSYTPQWYDFGEEGKAVKITSTGFLTTDAGTYYLVDGISQTGLLLIDGKYYYFTNAFTAKSGLENITEAKNNGLLPAGYYLFGDDFAMVDGKFATWAGAERWIVLGQPCFAGVMQDENGIYYIGSNAMIKNGLVTVANGKGNGILEDGTYLFGEDNYLTDNAFGYWQGNYVYFQDGQPYAAGPVEVAGKKYYIRSNCQSAKGTYYVSSAKANDVLSEGYYLFDEETGALVDGEFGQWQGKERYIKNGQPYYAGVIEYEGNLIYIGSDCTKKTGVNYISETYANGKVPAGYYLFDENGVIVWEGFGVWSDGNTYYFKNGQRNAAGVVNVDGKIYYIKGSCRAATGKCYVSAAKGNGILEEGYYTFGDDGALVTE